ncbi:hypothetical protein ENBRE01_0601 [Enteropsectra breve]|nr:hypothetical protein ENBRE01_0601 [Enteropsectra breve]
MCPRMEAIKSLIKDSSLEDAKEKILKMESALQLEKSPRNKEMLIRQIKELKDLYICAVERRVENIDAKKAEHKNIEVKLEINQTKNKFSLSNIKNQKFQDIQCVEAFISNCENIEISQMKCAKSLLLIDVKDSTVECAAEQIRLINCQNIALSGHSSTGIYLEGSNGIRIIKGNSGLPTVHDFSSPFSTENYTLQ